MPYLSKIQYGDFPVQNSGTKWDKKSPTQYSNGIIF